MYTPATKAAVGDHDENISVEAAADILGADLAQRVEAAALAIFAAGSAAAAKRGLIVADTKFEFGLIDGQLVLCDEVLTPDSSRVWPADGYAPGGPQPAFDKEPLRAWTCSMEPLRVLCSRDRSRQSLSLSRLALLQGVERWQRLLSQPASFRSPRSSLGPTQPPHSACRRRTSPAPLAGRDSPQSKPRALHQPLCSVPPAWRRRNHSVPSIPSASAPAAADPAWPARSANSVPGDSASQP